MNYRTNKIYLSLALSALILLLFSGCSLFGGSEDDLVISMEELPAAVKPLAEKETEGCKIIEVEKEIKDGKTIYAITYDQDGIEMEIEYTPSGELISKGRE